MFQANFTVTPLTGTVLATNFSVTNLTSGASVDQYTWDFGLGDLVYNVTNPTKIYNYPGTYTISLTAIDFDGNSSIHTQDISVDIAYRDYIRFTQIPERFSDPGKLTTVPFRFDVVSSNPDKPLVVDLFASNSRSTPYQYTSERWEFLTPTWKFLDKNLNPVTSLSLTSIPVYKDNVVVAVSGSGEFYYIDSTSTGDPTLNCPILLTVTLHTSGFSNPLDSSVYPYDSHANNQTVRAGVIWQINDLKPTLLKVTGNYVEDITALQWLDVKIPVLITAHSNRSQIISGSEDSISEVLFSYPNSNELGKLIPVNLTLNNLSNSEYTVDEAPLYFQATDSNNLQTGGYIFTTVTGLTTVSATSIVAQTTAYTSVNIPENEFVFPAGYAPNTSVWVSNPQKNTLNKITLVPDPGNCNTINYFKENGILTDGIIKEVQVPALSSSSTFNYQMSGFSGIYGVAIDPRNYDLIAADAELDRLYRFSNTGELLKTFELSSLDDYNPQKKMFEFWSWKAQAPTLSATWFTFYKPTPLSPNKANYIVQVGGAIQSPDTYCIDPYSGTLRILIFPSTIPENVDVDVIQIFNPALPTKHISSIMYWTSASPTFATTFPLTNNPSLSTDSNYYIVSIDGVVQSPDSFSIDDINQTITFDNAVPENTTVNVVYLPSTQPPVNWTKTFVLPTTEFELTNSINQSNYLPDPYSSFIVNIGGVLQNPDTYVFDVVNQKLVFNTNLPLFIPISVTQITVAENIDAPAALTPAHVSLDKNYNIWVSLFNSVSVLKFDLDFNLLFSVAPSGIDWSTRPWSTTPLEIDYQASRTNEAFENLPLLDPNSCEHILDDNEFFLKPPVTETDKDNNCWVTYANPLCCLLVKYNETGTPLLQIPFPRFSIPVGLAVNAQNNIWVGNTYGSSYSVTPLSGCIYLYNTNTAELLSSISNINRPGYIAVDRQNNLWFTHGLRNLGYYNTTTNVFSSWLVNSFGEFIPNPTFIDNEFFEESNQEDEELGGLAVDVYNRVWVLDTVNNYTHVLSATPYFNQQTIRTFKVIPNVTIGYYLDINTGSTYTEEGSFLYRSAQATGDWTGNRWYQKYANVQTISAIPVLGTSTNFSIVPFTNTHQIRRVNETFNTAEYYKSLALPEILSQNTTLFDKFFPATVGTGYLSANEDIGQTVYEKIANFVYNHADIDTCNIDQLLSLAEEVAVPASDYAAIYPTEIRNMIDIASVSRARLWGIKDEVPLLTQSIGTEYNTQTDVLTAGTSVILKSRFDSSLSLLQVPPLSTGETVYSPTLFTGFGLVEPVTVNYIFYRFNPAYTGKYIENLVDWDSPYTTQTRTASTLEEWYGDNGALETAFRYLLTKNLFPK